MVNELLVSLVNSVLGTGKRTARGNQSYHCPLCNHHTPKLEVNFTENKEGKHPWHCWHCDVKGTRISTLFKQIKAPQEKFEELYQLIKSEHNFQTPSYITPEIKLPEEYKTILGNSDIISRHALAYLKQRNVTEDDIEKYGIGYCSDGLYANMIIIPSYSVSGKLNYFTGRSFEKNPYKKYRNPEASRDIIPFELFINWSLPLIVCEGPFDAIAIKRNAIPLLGKNIQPNLMKKIVTSTVKKIYIALDRDAIKKSLKFAEYFMNEGKEVYLVELNEKDPGELGFKKFTELIQSIPPLNSYSLMETKLKLT